jgi:thioredoxin-like negative regulator of GroEL
MRTSLLPVFVALAIAPATAFAEPMVGPLVGNADLLAAEGTRLYNEKAYDQARDRFLKAARVSPTTLPTYLSLARSYFALKDLERACQVYRVFVKNSPESPDRDKAQGESELCDKQLAATGTASQLGTSYVSLKASFYEALDKANLSGPASAAELLASLVGAGYAAPDLGEMAKKLSRASELDADGTWQAALGHQKLAPADLRRASGLYQLSLDCGAVAAKQPARAAFLEGMALLAESKANQAEAAFDDAARKDPSDPEARFYRGLAKFLSGDRAGALKGLEADLPNDPRTGILRVAVSMDGASPAAAAELEKFLFARKYKAVP